MFQTNNRRYLRYKNKNEVICSNSIKLFFLNYDKKQMLMHCQSGSLAQKHDAEICLNNSIKTKVYGSITRKRLNL